MARLIDANKLTAVMRNLADHVAETHPVIAATMLTAIDIVAEQKTVDAVEVVHGWWRKVYTCHGEQAWGYECDQCKADNPRASHYCPNCGARMDGEEDG